MASYLLNATLVWLMSLVMYELFFRKETVHHWNRGYLLGTLLLGFVLPLISWGMEETVVPSTMRHSYRQVIEIKHAAVAAIPSNGGTSAGAERSVSWILIAYLGGLVLRVGMLIWDGVALLRLYNSGKKGRAYGFTLIETGGSHGPFSFFNVAFVTDAAQYSPSELEMILRHERRHGQLLHSVDILMIQLLRCLLWFHPLIHWYHHRLRMVHEFQADEVGRKNTMHYGRFLIQQAMLQPAPSLAHTFHHSSLKNRIAMLTRKRSAGIKLGKYLIVAPLLTVLTVCCTRPSSPEPMETKGNIVRFKGNTIEMSDRMSTTALFGADSTPQRPAQITAEPFPAKINGNVIYGESEVTHLAKYSGPEGSVAEMIFQRLKPALEELGNGEYYIGIQNTVVDAEGRLVYFETSGIATSYMAVMEEETPGGDKGVHFSRSRGIWATTPHSKPKPSDHSGSNAYAPEGTENNIPGEKKKQIDKFLWQILNAGIAFEPATKDNKAVASTIDSEFDFVGRKMIRVTNHKATLEDVILTQSN